MPYDSKTVQEILRYRTKPPNRRTVRRLYAQWRAQQGIPERCDNLACQLRQRVPLWNGYSLPLFLRHRNGRSRDNRVENLWYLCPNCDAQMSTPALRETPIDSGSRTWPSPHARMRAGR